MQKVQALLLHAYEAYLQQSSTPTIQPELRPTETSKPSFLSSLFPDTSDPVPIENILSETECYLQFGRTKCHSDMDILPWWKVSSYQITCFPLIVFINRRMKQPFQLFLA